VTDPTTDLNPRARVLLKTLVERYIEGGQPVGSRTLAHHAGLDLSPASIRNIMSDLEDGGFITSPHASAGRIPTPRGYRLFVDSLLTVKPLSTLDRHHIEAALGSHHDPQRLISTAANLLSELSQFASVIAVSRKREPCFRQIEFLRLSDSRVLLIIITEDSEVQNRILFTDKPYTQDQLSRAAAHFNEHYVGLTFDAVRPRLQHELTTLRSDISALMAMAVELGSEALGDTRHHYVVSGEANLLHTPDLSHNMTRMRELFHLFEHRTELMQLLNLGQRANGIQMFIGAEAGVAPLDECSVIAAPYAVNGEVVGTLGVIGPTRMAYERIIPIVDITSRLLSSALSHP
jgi:heat-inducible transcriptional repressor